jgi:cell division transport system ATP-binding protein
VSKNTHPFVVELKDVDREFVLQSQTDNANGQVSKLLALARVSLRLQSGEFVFLTGPSGAGKSTLLRLILGLDKASAGEIYTLGHAVHRLSESERRDLRRQIGIIFQDHKLISTFNVFENIELPLHFHKLSPKERERRVLEVLEVLQLRDHIYCTIETLSAGEKQRVAIARALVTCPALIIADEPTGAQDHENRWVILNEFLRYQAQGAAVLVATHDQELIRRVRQPVATLRSGRLWLGDAASLCSPSN